MSAAAWEDEPPTGRFDDDALPADIATGDVFDRPDRKSELAMHERPQTKGRPTCRGSTH